MNLPNVILIGGVEFEILLAEDLRSAAIKSKGKSVDGRINYNGRTIVIRRSLLDNPDKLKFVIVHEIAHGILHESGYVGHPEEEAENLGSSLHHIMKRNDLGWIAEKESKLTPEELCEFQCEFSDEITKTITNFSNKNNYYDYKDLRYVMYRTLRDNDFSFVRN